MKEGLIDSQFSFLLCIANQSFKYRNFFYTFFLFTVFSTTCGLGMIQSLAHLREMQIFRFPCNVCRMPLPCQLMQRASPNTPGSVSTVLFASFALLEQKTCLFLSICIVGYIDSSVPLGKKHHSRQKGPKNLPPNWNTLYLEAFSQVEKRM